MVQEIITRGSKEDLVQKVRKKVLEEFEKLRVTLEDDEISVYTALVDDDVVKLVLIALEEAKQPISWRDFKKIFSGVVGEDRLRKILSNLKARNIIAELTHTRYALPKYVPPEEINKVKNPGIIPIIEAELKKRNVALPVQ